MLFILCGAKLRILLAEPSPHRKQGAHTALFLCVFKVVKIEDFKSIGRPKRGATFKLYFIPYILSVISIEINIQIVSLVEEKSIKTKR